jgi:SAM-dependent methyltransferase
MYDMKKFHFLKDHLDDVKPCIVCNSTKLELYAERDFMSAYKCSKCGMISVNPYLTEHGASLFYQTYFQMRKYNDPLKSLRDSQYEYDKNFLIKFISPGKILDIGCSGGYFLSTFDDQWDKHGGDLTEDAIEEAQNLFGIKGYVGDVNNINFECKFDVVTMRGVLEHVKYPRILFDTLLRLIKPGGYFYISATPHGRNYAFDLFRGNWRLFTPLEHVHFFEPHHISRMLGDRFKLVRVDFPYFGTPYCDYENDLNSIAQVQLSLANNEPLNVESRAFPGAMMNCIWQFI